MYVKERFSPLVIAANSTVTVHSDSIGGFLCLTSGTISVTDEKGNTIVNAVPVTAGVYTPIPFYLGVNGGTVTTAGGASGTIAV